MWLGFVYSLAAIPLLYHLLLIPILTFLQYILLVVINKELIGN